MVVGDGSQSPFLPLVEMVIEMMSLGRESTAEELGFFVGIHKPLLCLEAELSIHAMEELMSFNAYSEREQAAIPLQLVCL